MLLLLSKGANPRTPPLFIGPREPDIMFVIGKIYISEAQI
jgi:hypothetical protein